MWGMNSKKIQKRNLSYADCGNDGEHDGRHVSHDAGKSSRYKIIPAGQRFWVRGQKVKGVRNKGVKFVIKNK